MGCTNKRNDIQTFQDPPNKGPVSSSEMDKPLLVLPLFQMPTVALTTQTRDKRANAKADQWMNLDSVSTVSCDRIITYLEERWWSKIAHKDQAIAMLAGRSPSVEEKAYAVAVASKKNLG